MESGFPIRSPQFPSMGLINDGLVRRPGDYSPRSSPRGNRSPVVSRPDTTGTLKTTISLRSTPAIVHSTHTGPFYLLKDNVKPEHTLSGSTNMMLHYNLEHTFNKFIGKKVKDKLSAFLPTLPGNIDVPVGAEDAKDSLRRVINAPPLGGRDLIPLNGAMLAGFRLHPGPLPEQYRFSSIHALKKKKHKKHKTEVLQPGIQPVPGAPVPVTLPVTDGGPSTIEIEKKHKRPKKHDEERKKKKKDKKKKKRHSPEPPDMNSSVNPLAPNTPSSANRMAL